MVAKHPDLLVRVRPNGLEDTPQFKLDVDQEKAQALGVSLSDINETISAALGGYYVNDFIDRGRVKKVYVQADAQFRMLPGDINNLYVRSAMARWCPSLPLAQHGGFMVRHAWNAITGCRQWNCSVKQRPDEVPVKPCR